MLAVYRQMHSILAVLTWAQKKCQVKRAAAGLFEEKEIPLAFVCQWAFVAYLAPASEEGEGKKGSYSSCRRSWEFHRVDLHRDDDEAVEDSKVN